MENFKRNGMAKGKRNYQHEGMAITKMILGTAERK
jgi:hypothetical protein